MLDSEIIARVRGIALRARRRVDQEGAGAFASVFRGRGMEFDHVREYVPGDDDVRNIDWNVTARLGHPYVKIFCEERELTILVVLDVSQSQDFLVAGKSTKRDIAAELAGILAFLAAKNNDRVGLTLFSDRIESHLPPRKGRGYVWKVVRSVIASPCSGSDTRLGAALDFVTRVQRRRCLCFVISDFHATGYEDSLRRLARRHEVTCVAVSSRREDELPAAGIVEFVDAETGQPRTVDLGHKGTRMAINAALAARREKLKSLCHSSGAEYWPIAAASGPVDQLIGYLLRRTRK